MKKERHALFHKMKNNHFAFFKKVLVLMILITGLPILVNGQEVNANSTNEFLFYTLVGVIFLVMLLVLLTAAYTLNVLKAIITHDHKKRGIVDEEPSWWGKLKGDLVDAVPIEKEDTVLLTHDYDGIHELDNHLPPWWTGLFYLTIIFAVGYLGIYHIWKSAPLQTQEYQNELLAAAQDAGNNEVAKGPQITAENVTLITDASVIAKGQAIYSGNCVPCHRNDGGGLPGLGPNLTDEFWLHGGGISNIFKTISDGIPTTSMISWKTQMSPTDIQAVSSYVVSLEGSNPPNGREPQGERYSRAEALSNDDSGEAIKTDSLTVETN